MNFTNSCQLLHNRFKSPRSHIMNFMNSWQRQQHSVNISKESPHELHELMTNETTQQHISKFSS